MSKQNAEERQAIAKENEEFSIFDQLMGPEKMAQLLLLGGTVHLAVLKLMVTEKDSALFQAALAAAVAVVVGLGVSYRTKIANNGEWGTDLQRISGFVPDFNVLYLLYIPSLLSLLFARDLTVVNMALAFNCTDHPLILRLPLQAIFVLMNNDFGDKRSKNLKAIGINCLIEFLIERIGQLKSFDRVESNLFSICLTNVLFLLESSSLHFQVLRHVLLGFLAAVAFNFPLLIITSRFNPYLRSAILSTSFFVVFPLTILYTFEVEGQNPAIWLFDYITSNDIRVRIIAGWLSCLVILVPNIMIFKSNFSLDTSRKIWHFLILALIAVPFRYDPDFVKISLAGTIVLFLAVEYLRFLKLAPYGELLDSKLRSFADFRDERGPIIISYIYLIIGVATPILINGSLVGVISLGVGDSLASIVGYRWGRHQWPGTSKTLEGTFAFILSTSICSLCFKLFLGAFQEITSAQVILACVLSGILEGNSVLNDNILIPAYMFVVTELLK